MSSTDKYLRKQVAESFEQWQNEFNQEFGLSMNVRIEFSLRGKSTGGTANHSDNLICLNMDWIRYNVLDVMGKLIPHEIAHIVADDVFPHAKMHHGKEWEHVMLKMGVAPTRLFKGFGGVKPARVTKQFLYVLPCGCDYYCGVSRHKVWQTGERKRKYVNMDGKETYKMVKVEYSCTKHGRTILPEHFVKQTR